MSEGWQNVIPNPIIITLQELYLKYTHPNAHLFIHLFMRYSYHSWLLSEDQNSVLLLILQYKFSSFCIKHFQATPPEQNRHFIQCPEMQNL